MKKLPLIALCFSLFFVFNIVRADSPVPASPAPAASSVSVDQVPLSTMEALKVVFCTQLKDHDPADEITSAKVGDTVIGWSQIRSGLGDVKITHRWKHGDAVVTDVPLDIKGSPYRTWSRKTMFEAGSWTLQVLNPEGQVLKEISLTVTP